MANLKELITSKTERDAQWKEQRQVERESIAAMRDASVTEITSSPKSYGRWLETQGQNLMYSPGNVALVMAQLPEPSLIATVDRWKTLGRSVLAAEQHPGSGQADRAVHRPGHRPPKAQPRPAAAARRSQALIDSGRAGQGPAPPSFSARSGTFFAQLLDVLTEG